MSRKNETERQKQIQEKCQMLLTKMLRDDDNKYCVDCDAKGPRWASWNLGVFLCIRCAGIHRNLGVHISRVKSVNLDSWTPEQVVSLEQMGNSRARAVYEAMLPDGFRRPQTDSALENFIRAKYEHKKYLAREWVPPPPPKVDWDKEIDEELERQKRKKKSSSGAGSLGNALSLTSPASASTDKRTSSSGGYSSSSAATTASSSAVPLPKLKAPASSTKSSSRTSSDGGNAANAGGTQPPSAQSQPSSGSSDLLSLSLGPVDVTADRTPKKVHQNGQQATGASGGDGLDILNRGTDEFSNLAKEEADFFNQASSSVGGLGIDSGKLTKDKIMALYGAAPSTVPVVNQGFGGSAGGSGGFGAFGSFQQAGNTYPPATNTAATVPGAYNGPGGFGAFQAFPGAPPVAGGAVMNGQFVMPGQQAPPMMYNNLVANGGVPFQQPTVAQGMIPPQPFGAMQFPNALLQQQHQQHQQQPPLVGGVGFPTMGGMPPSGGFANFPKQQPAAQSTVQSNDKLSNQFGNMNLRDVWQ